MMMKVRIAVSLTFLLLATAVFAQDATKSFESLKSLAGTWQGKSQQGKFFQVSFRVTSGGSAVLSEIKNQDEDMITMFNLDGHRLLMTHYCAAGNQPRMQASASPDGKTITFDFLDATNLAGASDGYMHKLVLTMIDSDHHTEDWYFVKAGKEMKESFELERKKTI
jgi:hypothetical protein